MLIINLAVIGTSLAGIGSSHDKNDVEKSLSDLQSINFEHSFGYFVDVVLFIVVQQTLWAYFGFANCLVDYEMDVGGLANAQMIFSIEYKPCIARAKLTTTSSLLYSDDATNKQATVIETDVENWEETEFCKKLSDDCASAGATSSALYGVSFGLTFINLVLQVMRFMADDMRKCMAAAGIELLTLIFMLVGTIVFPSNCTEAAMSELKDLFIQKIAFGDDDVISDTSDSAFTTGAGIVQVMAILAVSISFTLISCIACSRPKDEPDQPAVQNITIVNNNAAPVPGSLASQDAQGDAMEMHQFYGVNPMAGQQFPQQYPPGYPQPGQPAPYPGQPAPYPVNYPGTMSPGIQKEKRSSKKAKKSLG